MLIVCDLSRLDRATLEPEGIHTGGRVYEGGKGVKKERVSKCNGYMPVVNSGDHSQFTWLRL